MVIALVVLVITVILEMVFIARQYSRLVEQISLVDELNQECDENIELLREMEEVLKHTEVERKAIFDTLETLSKRPNLAVISNEQIQQLADILDSKNKNNWMN